MPLRFFSGHFFASAVLASILIALTGSVWAQNAAGPEPAPLPPPIQAPADVAYPGTISLSVDLTNVNDRVLNVHETIPVKAGAITLLYPQWLPGTHSPSNAVQNLAGLVITANGNRVPWLRDRVDMWAFHVNVPKGATTLDLNFQHLAPIKPQQGRISNKIAD
ncbi:MAG: peptidase M61, partial [Candidatus Sulfotelmatobacter sp.]